MRPATELLCELYDTLRPPALERLVALRGVKPGHVAPAAVERAQLEALLARMGEFLRTGDERPYRAFLARWLAVVVGDGAPPTSLFSSVRTTCEVVVELAEAEVAADAAALAVAMARLQFFSARILVDILARENERVQRLCGGL